MDNPNGNAIRDTKKEDLMTDEGMHVDTAMESAKVFSNEDIDATDNVDAAEEDATEEAEEDLNNNELDSASSDADSMAGDYRHLLSVESLAAIAKQQRSDSRVALPKTMVAKELLPADPAVNPFLAREQRLLIDDALWVRDQVLREPHTVHMKSACEGVWYEDLQLAEITAARGNAMLTMGRSYNARTYLLAEEALFLVGRGSLLLFHKGLPMSYRKAFAMLARGPGAIERQRVYDHLKRLGYVITRHGLGFQQFPEDIQQKLGPVKAKREVVVPSNDDVASASLEPRVEAVVAHSLPAESTSDQAISKPLPVAIREDDLLSRQAYAPFGMRSDGEANTYLTILHQSSSSSTHIHGTTQGQTVVRQRFRLSRVGERDECVFISATGPAPTPFRRVPYG